MILYLGLETHCDGKDEDFAAAPWGEHWHLYKKNFSPLGLPTSRLFDAWSHHQLGPADEPTTLNRGQNNLQTSKHCQRHRHYRDAIIGAYDQNNSFKRASVFN